MVLGAFLYTYNTRTLLQSITLPTDDIPDVLQWISALDGQLTSKIAFSSLFGNGPKVSWATIIWNSYIPPSRAFITWRLLHNKIPTDENLRKRGCIIVSGCCFCLKQAKSSSHIFFDCIITSSLWDWLSKGLDIPLNLSSCLNLLLNSMRRGSKMVQQIMQYNQLSSTPSGPFGLKEIRDVSMINIRTCPLCSIQFSLRLSLAIDFA